MLTRTSRCGVLALALAAGCSPVGVPAEPTQPGLPPADGAARRKAEDAAIARLEKTLRVDYKREGGRPDGAVVWLELHTPIGKVGDTAQYDGDLAPLAELTELRELRILSSRVNGTGLRHLGPLVELRRLELSSSEVDDTGLKALPMLPNLETVILGATRVTDAGLLELKRHPKLRELHFTESAVTAKAFRELASFPALRHLETGGAERGNAELQALAKIAKLERLSFWARDGVTAEGVKALASCEGLASLTLELHRLDATALEPLGKLPDLREVRLSGPFVTDEVARVVSSWGQVRHLKLGWNKGLTDRGLGSVAKMKNLESLSFDAAVGVGNAGMAEVGKLTNLRSLNLSGTKVGDAGVAKLAGLTKLRALDLSVSRGTAVSGAAIRSLAPLTELDYLDLFGMRITDEDIDDLAKFKKLKWVKLWDTKVTEAGAERLRKALPDAKVIR